MLGLAALVLSPVALAERETPSALPLGSAKSPEGRPDVHLDRLEFPVDVPNGTALQKHLRRVLEREVRRVEWGAGRDNRIEYRFKVNKLELSARGSVLEVSCSATGMWRAFASLIMRMMRWPG